MRLRYHGHFPILNPQSSIPNPQSSILNPHSSILNPQSSILNNSTTSTNLQQHSHNCFSISASVVYRPPSTRLKKWHKPCQHSITTPKWSQESECTCTIGSIFVDPPTANIYPFFLHWFFLIYSWRWISSHNLPLPPVASSSSPPMSPKYHVRVKNAKLR